MDGTVATVQLAVKSVLSREQVEWFVHYKEYRERLTFLSTLVGYSKYTDVSFMGKNLMNSCHPAGQDFPHLDCLRVTHGEQHPDGSGATHEI